MPGIEVAAASVRIEPDLARFGPQLQRGVQSQLRQTAAAASQLGGSLSAAITLPVAAAAAGSVRSFANFDQAITNSLAIVTDFGTKTRADFEETAKEIGRTTAFGADQAAEAFFFLASAGLSAEQQIASLPQVAAFATAGQFDLATATDLATDAQSALGLTVDDAAANLSNLTRVTDVLVGANTLANASVEQFSRSLTNRAGAALRLVNKDVEEGVAVLAAFADQGVKGEEAGTRLDIVLRDLQSQAIKNADEFDRFGISVFDTEGNMRNIADVIEDVEGALIGQSDATKRQTLLQLGFQDRSVASLLTLVGLSDNIREYESELRTLSGTTREIADKQLQSFNSQLKIARDRISIAGIALGEKLAPSLVTIADFAADAVEAFAALPAPIRNATLVTLGLAAAAGPLLLIGGRIAQTVLALRQLQATQLATAGSARALAAAEGTAAASIAGVGVAARGAAATRTITGVGGATSALTVGAAGAAGARGGFLGRLFGRGGAGGAASAAGFGAKLARGLGISFATELGAGFVEAIPTQEGTIADTVKSTGSAALRGAGIGATVGSIIPGIGTAIGAGAGALVGGAIGFFRNRGGAEAIQDEVTDAVAGAAQIPEEVAQLQGQALSNLIQDVVTQGLDQGLSIEEAGAKAAELRQSIENGLAEGLSFEQARARAVEEINGLTDLIGAELAEIPGAASPLIDQFSSIFENVWGAARDVSASEIEDLIVEQQTQLASFEAAVETIYAAGAEQIANQLREAGPGAAGEANALAEDIVTALRIEGRLRGVAEENLDAYVDALQIGDQNTANILAGVQTIEEIIREQSPVFRDVGEEQAFEYTDGINQTLSLEFPFTAALAAAGAEDVTDNVGNILGYTAGLEDSTQYVDGVSRGLSAASARWSAIAASAASSVTRQIRDNWEISSPSRVGQSLGASFVEGISLGITSTDIPIPQAPGLDGTADLGETSGQPSTVNTTYEITVNNPTETESIARGTERALAYARLASS